MFTFPIKHLRHGMNSVLQLGQMEVDVLVKNKSTIRLVDWSKKFQLGKRTMIYMLHDTRTVNLLLDWSRRQEAGVSIIAFE
jgi:hypothetical protein